MSGLLSVEEARARLLALFSPVGTESVPLAAAGGRVLAEDAVATRPQPPFDASAMDGYAIREEDHRAGNRLAVIGASAAGARFEGAVRPGTAVRIFTGAPVPDGADRVVIQENTTRVEDSVTLDEAAPGGTNIRPAGGDFMPGDRIAAPRRLAPADLALLAAMNIARPVLRRRPVVALIATGDELAMPGETPGPDQILCSNNFGLKAMLEAAGAEARMLPIARDTPESLTAAFDLAAGADLVVTLGGASVGEHDLVRATALGRGLDLSFYKIAMRPGKPLMAGRLGTTPMIGLPGNPVSAMVCGLLFVLPAVRRMLGLPEEAALRFPARLEAALEPNGPRAHYMMSRAEPEPGGWRIEAFGRQDSSLLSVLSRANALLVRPPHDPARASGDRVEFLWI
ncbi:molybdopterin molybdotransferase MoeA [Amaricoccus solimangrovi]|uniref:Molybdopterin molybdenumtransferase n=1 Tax=Amaricoccus solimangrovi TaxID=2589815 RepID=A0A501X0X4_9RHOB|nr:gephyrin-like molybdotransferase Glp [Amaricoccus solimangrovi]TPE53741.1 molybdopterin molybdotransferase MoeA [Amaricoccus solimangrovi]